MNTNLITYEDKETLNTNPSIPSVNKVESGDMNEIKSAINTGLLNLIYPVGCYFETSDDDFNPNNSWGGTWELETDGTVLVSKSSESGSAFNTTVGSIVGEEKHTLTVNEMPKHNHPNTNEGHRALQVGYVYQESSDKANITSAGYALETPGYTGGGQAHNNIQPSKIINRWHRTA